MVNAIAINEIVINDLVVGYKLKSSDGSIMDIKTEAIISAIKAGKININNLILTSNDKLEMVKTVEKSNNKQRHFESADRENRITKISRMRELVEKLNKARMVYEQGHDEIMSNFEYDKLYEELDNIENELGIVLNNSPTINVGYEVISKLPKENHTQPMLSLDKTKDRVQLKSFLNGKQGVLSWKLDGLTVVLTYENGILLKAVTRGNGEIGEVVTNNAKHFKNIPKKISFNGKLVLRGEAIIKYSDFEKINSEIINPDEKYKNPRNLCSGSVRQLDSSITASRNINWFCFEVVECTGYNLSNSVDEQFKFISNLGFEPVEHFIVDNSNFDSVIAYFESSVVGKNSDVPSDGLVLTFRDKNYGVSLGRTSKFPRHSIAFKWQDENVISEIEYVEWSPSRTGLINPVAVFKPVDIDGSTVSRASVHNVSIFADMQLGYGDRVSVFKANKIIPQISDNLDRTATCEIPSLCPCCGEPTEINEDPKSGVLTLWCYNANCSAKGNKLMEHFVSRDAMNIDGVSSATLETLSENGIVTDLVSIYHIYEHQQEVMQLEGFGYTSFINMVNSIEKSRNVKLSNLLYALGIPNIGLSTAKLICKSFDNDLARTVTATYSQLINIDGVGDVIAQSFVNYFNDEENAKQFIRLVKELRIINEEVSTNSEMAGVTICVTGDVYIFKNRREIKDIVENLGGKLTGSVSKSTSYLITNDTTSGSNKNKAAQSYGIPILTEKEFIDKFNLSKYI